jgi:hypothetical protein
MDAWMTTDEWLKLIREPRYIKIGNEQFPDESHWMGFICLHTNHVVPDVFAYDDRLKVFTCGGTTVDLSEVMQVLPFSAVYPPGFKPRVSFEAGAQP